MFLSFGHPEDERSSVVLIGFKVIDVIRFGVLDRVFDRFFNEFNGDDFLGSL